MLYNRSSVLLLGVKQYGEEYKPILIGHISAEENLGLKKYYADEEYEDAVVDAIYIIDGHLEQSNL
jgi:hypothetical protein